MDEVRRLLDALVDALAALGPLAELDRRWREPSRPRSPEALRDAVARAKAVRAEIQDLLDRPACSYDVASLALHRALVAIPSGERGAVRALIGEGERRALLPCAQRAPWLALEERSAERLLSGLMAQALRLPDQDDYRDVMIALAPSLVCAAELGADPAGLFDDAATFAGPGVAGTFRSFGRRETSLGAFGWRRVETAYGTRFHLGT